MTTLVLSMLIFSSTSSHGTFVDGVDEFEGPGWSWSRVHIENASNIVVRIEYESEVVPGKPDEVRATLYDSGNKMLTTANVVSIANAPSIEAEAAGQESTHFLVTTHGTASGFWHFPLAHSDGRRLTGDYSILTWAVGPFTRWNVSLSTIDGSLDVVSTTRGNATYALTTNEFDGGARLTAYPAARVNLHAKTEISANAMMIGTFGAITGLQPTERIWAHGPKGDPIACPCHFLDSLQNESWGPGAYTFHHFGAAYPAWYGNLPSTPPPPVLLGVIATPPP
ncbi:MAG TPA: hypothetical protein VM889_04275 [Candidatus Thermoplasmatota archaeon]|nr:hypothetical protein [Candidatus Thermoplasmatota archaeon]